MRSRETPPAREIRRSRCRPSSLHRRRRPNRPRRRSTRPAVFTLRSSASVRTGFAEIPAGCFVMGSPEDEWGRGQTREQRVNVTLTRPFVVQKYEVTQKEWMAAGFANPSGKMADGTGDCLDATCPVGNVTWFEAAAYANLSSERNLPPLPPCYELDGCTGTTGTGMKCTSASTATGSVYDCAGYRLPTDAEWEYATRAGTRSAFYSGDITVIGTIGECHPDQNLLRIAWYCSNSGGATHPVGQLEPNAWGLHDVSGNAAEWVNDVSTGLPPGRGMRPRRHDRHVHSSRLSRRALQRVGELLPLRRPWNGLLGREGPRTRISPRTHGEVTAPASAARPGPDLAAAQAPATEVRLSHLRGALAAHRCGEGRQRASGRSRPRPSFARPSKRIGTCEATASSATTTGALSRSRWAVTKDSPRWCP